MFSGRGVSTPFLRKELKERELASPSLEADTRQRKANEKDSITGA
jgi:hypothetical protein